MEIQLLRIQPSGHGETDCSTKQSLAFLHLYMILPDEHFLDFTEHII